jgi:protein phosphatase 2C family protein 2/3
VPAEKSRVVASGHYVEDGRVDGVIAISRALGDWEFKSSTLSPDKMAVSGVPEVSKTAITANSNFIICACDGIWDCMTSQQACDFVIKSKLRLPRVDLKLGKQSSTSSSKSGGKGVKPKGPA